MPADPPSGPIAATTEQECHAKGGIWVLHHDRLFGDFYLCER